jgi:hypothetical protein
MALPCQPVYERIEYWRTTGQWADIILRWIGAEPEGMMLEFRELEVVEGTAA